MAAMRTLFLAAALVGSTAAKHVPPPPAPAAELPTTVAPTVRAGVEKWRAGDYAGAVAIWQPFAQAGDADALFNMGQAYKLGRGVPADAATARDYYRKAAMKGHLPAQANLGIALFQAGEKPEAIKWLKTAADRGEARAQYVLGIAAYNGDGLPRSQSLGYGYLLRAQASGLPQAVTALAGIAPALSPTDRTAGEAVAASLAAGAGVPSALAAATAPKLIPAMPRAAVPVVTPPSAAAPAAAPPPSATVSTKPAAPAATTTTTTTAALGTVPPKPVTPPPVLTTAVPTAAAAKAPAAGAVPPARPVPAVRTTGAADAGSRPPADAAARPATASADRSPLPPRPAPAVPLHETTPAQADAAAGVPPRPAVATVDIPASRPSEPPKAEATVRAPVKAAEPTRVAVRQPPLKPFETVDAPVKKADGWRVQLGAFSSRKLADAAWADAKDAAGSAKPVFATDGPVTKLQMGPFPTRDAARAACTRLTAAGRACFVTQG